MYIDSEKIIFMIKRNIWIQKIEKYPRHSKWYIEKFRHIKYLGEDINGEARLVDAMCFRYANILDAGCGSGRVGGYLANLGYKVVGVDIDPILVEAAIQDYPKSQWLVNNLLDLHLADQGSIKKFDIIISAGNVVAFLVPSTRIKFFSNLYAYLKPEGRLIIGFSFNRGYTFSKFLKEILYAGFVPELLLSTWGLQVFAQNSNFLIAILRQY